jgi:hypothetical protein
MNWPGEKLTVNILDDGGKPAVAKMVRKLAFQLKWVHGRRLACLALLRQAACLALLPTCCLPGALANALLPGVLAKFTARAATHRPCSSPVQPTPACPAGWCEWHASSQPAALCACGPVQALPPTCCGLPGACPAAQPNPHCSGATVFCLAVAKRGTCMPQVHAA